VARQKRGEASNGGVYDGAQRARRAKGAALDRWCLSSTRRAMGAQRMQYFAYNTHTLAVACIPPGAGSSPSLSCPAGPRGCTMESYAPSVCAKAAPTAGYEGSLCRIARFIVHVMAGPCNANVLWVQCLCVQLIVLLCCALLSRALMQRCGRLITTRCQHQPGRRLSNCGEWRDWLKRAHTASE
jgi:hypothetical protein